MSITNSLYIGISGLQAHGDAISVVGDNIANASTIGFKRERASFADMLGGELGASRLGGGVRLSGTQTMWAQGAVTQTGNPLDLALRGNGMFVVKGDHGGQTGNFYTRDGRFAMDNQGYVVNQQGLRLQGYAIDAAGTRSPTVGDLPIGARTSPAIATANATLDVGLDANADSTLPPWDPTNPTTMGKTSNYATSQTVYDSLGNTHHVEVYFKNNGGGNWEYHAMVDGGEVSGGTPNTPFEIATGTLTFNSDGKLQAQTMSSPGVQFNNATAQTIAFNFGKDLTSGGDGSGSSMRAGLSSADAADVDGRGTGALTNINITDDGKIQGTFDNGDKIDLAQVAVADFANMDGLARAGDGLMTSTTESGQALVDVAGSGARGSLSSGALEASNVDLGNELVTLIAYQRAFQANAKTVTTADEMLTDVNNLKR